MVNVERTVNTDFKNTKRNGLKILYMLAVLQPEENERCENIGKKRKEAGIIQDNFFIFLRVNCPHNYPPFRAFFGAALQS